MYKDSQVTRLDAWALVEEADALPALSYPAFVGTGRLGIGLDAGGLQSLPDRLGPHYNCNVPPCHVTQSELYILREGLLATHLWEDEMRHTGRSLPADMQIPNVRRNFMPLGYLTQSCAWDGQTVEGDALRRRACFWRREWSLRDALVKTSYSLAPGFQPLPAAQPLRLSIEAFAPYGGETVYLRLERTPGQTGSGDFVWTVTLPLCTRHGLPLYDQEGAVAPGPRTLLATIDPHSRFQPPEPYAVVYGVAAAGMAVAVSAAGWTATLRGLAGEGQTAWLRLDFRRLSGATVSGAAAVRDALERELAAFSRAAGEAALRAHIQEYHAFWARTADIEVEAPDAFETRRRFMLHMSEYLLRAGNEHALGGTVQFLLVHQNGWNACNFHDHHYIIDGIARANLWEEAEEHARWMHRVMRPEGRPFPWMLTYDGGAVMPPERDRAPMSDANRALLAMRLYELAGQGRARLLRETVYPILQRVAEHGAREWCCERDGGLIFRAVENDVMSEVPRESEAGTVIMYITVLRKAAEYAERLGVDAERRRVWRELAGRLRLEVADGYYRAWHNAPPGAATSCWFTNGFYIAEAQAYLDDATYRRTRDRDLRVTPCNHAWLNYAAASSEIRLGRPDRAEMFVVDSLTNRLHGPGYFEECVPNGISSLPPFATAHGAHLTAACEQIVLPDFWRPRVYVGKGMPSGLRARRVRFSSLRAVGGVLVSGESDPRHLVVHLEHTGDPLELEVVLRIPCECGMLFRVRRDGVPAEHAFEGESVTVPAALATGQSMELRVEDE